MATRTGATGTILRALYNAGGGYVTDDLIWYATRCERPWVLLARARPVLQAVGIDIQRIGAVPGAPGGYRLVRAG